MAKAGPSTPSWASNGSLGSSSNDNEVQYAKKLTRSLQRVRATMEINVSAASNVASLLELDGSSIMETLDTHKYELKNALSSTSSRLSRVKNAEWREKVAVLGSLLFFTATVTYIIAKRTRVLAVLFLTLQGMYTGQRIAQSLYERQSIAMRLSDSAEAPSTIELARTTNMEREQVVEMEMGVSGAEVNIILPDRDGADKIGTLDSSDKAAAQAARTAERIKRIRHDLAEAKMRKEQEKMAKDVNSRKGKSVSSLFAEAVEPPVPVDDVYSWPDEDEGESATEMRPFAGSGEMDEEMMEALEGMDPAVVESLLMSMLHGGVGGFGDALEYGNEPVMDEIEVDGSFSEGDSKDGDF